MKELPKEWEEKFRKELFKEPKGYLQGVNDFRDRVIERLKERLNNIMQYEGMDDPMVAYTVDIVDEYEILIHDILGLKPKEDE